MATDTTHLLSIRAYAQINITERTPTKSLGNTVFLREREGKEETVRGAEHAAKASGRHGQHGHRTRKRTNSHVGTYRDGGLHFGIAATLWK